MFPTAHPYAHFLRAWLTVLALLGAWPAHAVFSDNGDGTVTDTLTLLIWDKCSWGQSGNTCATGSASNYTWAAALGIAARAKAAHYKGHNDWRLPNVAELESLVKRDTSNPAIDRTAFPNTSSERYWSSTIYTPNPAYAWYVHFGNGGTGAGNQSYNGHVRLVRSGQSLGSFDRQSPRSAQTVTFGSAQSVAVGGAATLSATASSGLPVTFSSLTASICTVSGNTVTGIATGTCIIAANQAGNSSTSPAAQVTQSFSIAAPATYTLTVNSSGAAGVAIISLPTTYAGTSNYSKSGIAAGTRIMLTAPTATGNSTFNRWSGCDVASGVTCSVTMNAAKSVTVDYSTAVQPVLRKAIEFYHSALKHYFITLDAGEAAQLDSAGWARTGGSFNAWSAPASGNQPVCRFYGSQNPGPNSHFFTVDANECAALRAQQAVTPETVKKWHYEGIAFYSVPPLNAACAGTTPVYRYYNNGYARGEDSNHRLTTDVSQREKMETDGWGYEGVVMCAEQGSGGEGGGGDGGGGGGGGGD